MLITWIYLIVGGIFESCWVVTMKKSEGFTIHRWNVATVVLVFISIYLLALAMEKMGPGTAYAVWTGIGAVGALVFGILLFDETIDFTRIGFICLIIAGIVGLNLTGAVA